MASNPQHRPDSKLRILFSFFLFAGVFCLYWQARSFEFVNYDDPGYIVENDYVKQGLGKSGLVWAFTTYTEANWHPFTWLSHMLDVTLFGMKPGAHHLVNVFLHGLNTLLLFRVMLMLLSAGKMNLNIPVKPEPSKQGSTQLIFFSSFVVAVLFAVHPLNVQSVAWISERKNLLSTTFWFLAMISYIRYVRKPGMGSYGLVLLSFIGGLLTKPMIVTLPCVLLLMDWWPLNRLLVRRSQRDASVNWRVLVEKVPFFLLVILCCLVTLKAQHAGGAIGNAEVYTFRIRVTNAAVAYATYLWKTIWPANLAVFYPHPGPSVTLLQVLGSTAVLLAITVYAFLARNSRSWFLFGWLWFLGTMVPVSGLVQVGGQAMADRYAYVPLIGVFIIVASGAYEIARRVQVPEFVVHLGFAVLSLCFCFGTIQNLPHWHDSISLFTRALKVTKDNEISRNNLGEAMMKNGDVQGAKEQFLAAIRLNPKHERALNNLGAVAMKENNYAEAEQFLRKAVEIEPSSAQIHYNLANVYMMQNRLPEAAEHYRQTIQHKPDYITAYNNLAAALARQGHTKEAIIYFEKALEFNPLDAEVLFNLGRALSSEGQLERAEQYFHRALQLNASDFFSMQELGLIAVKGGRYNEASNYFTRAIQTNPKFFPAYFQMGLLMKAQGNISEAIGFFQETLKLKPDHPKAMEELSSLTAGTPAAP